MIAQTFLMENLQSFKMFWKLYYLQFKVSMLIRKQLIDRARDFNIILDDVALTELSFGKEYAAAVEAKQIAQQEAQRAAYTVEKAKQEKQQKIVQADGEAQAATMLGVAITRDPGYLKLREAIKI